MKKKNVILVVSIIICLIACILIFLVNVLGLNIIKHKDIQLGELSVKYYGSFSSVKTVKIYDGAIRLGTFELSVSNEILDNSNKYLPYLDDLNQDGHNDILIPHSLDENGSIRYSVYTWNNEIKMYEGSKILADVSNLTFSDDGNLHSFINLHKTIYPADKNIPEIYETHRISTEYKLIDARFYLVRNYTLIYYSETDAYCYVMADYDTESGEIVSFVEDWMTEEEAAQIKFYK